MGGSFAARSGFLDALPRELRGVRLWFLTASRGSVLAGAVPVALTERRGLRSAYSLPFGTYGGPLVDPSELDPATVRSELARAFAPWLAEQRIAGGEVVRGPSAEDSADPAWAALAERVIPGTAHIVSLAGTSFDSYAEGLKHETKKGLRHAARDGVRAGEEPQALEEAYGLYRRQAQAWRGHRPYSLDFLSTLLAHPSKFARLFVARRGSELVCAILALAGGEEALLWWSGSSPASRPLLAYPYLIVEIVRTLAADGIQRVNVGSSGGIAEIERFKESLGAKARSLWTYRLGPRVTDPASRLLLWARSLKRRA